MYINEKKYIKYISYSHYIYVIYMHTHYGRNMHRKEEKGIGRMNVGVWGGLQF